MNWTRRKFLKQAGTTALATPILSTFCCKHSVKDSLAGPLEIHLFSKHLQFLDWSVAATKAKELGFAGLDLTVRPKGHILPERVETDLPLAIKAVQQAGLSCKMITTAVEDATNPLDQQVVATAAAEGVQYYRTNWFRYPKEQSLEDSLAYYTDKVAELSRFNKEHNIIGCYQNHSGTKVGASVWEIKQLLEKAELDYFGAQYDIRHAVAEGGRSWPNGVQLLKDNIKVIVLKDFKWGKVDGKWTIINVPIGEGMVDFDAYFKLLKKYKLKPPVSLHLEYPLGGANKGKAEISVSPEVVYAAMRKDLNRIQELWQAA